MIIFEMIAILSCTIFAGAAIYINVAEHPARLECGTEIAATVFPPSYTKAAAMQVSLAILATISGVTIAMNGGSWLWYVGAFLIFFVIPFTFIAIMPTNNQLLDPECDRASPETEKLLRKWGVLHAIRSFSSALGSILYVFLGVAY